MKVCLEFGIRNNSVQKSSPYLQKEEDMADLRENYFLSASYLTEVGVSVCPSVHNDDSKTKKKKKNCPLGHF